MSRDLLCASVRRPGGGPAVLPALGQEPAWLPLSLFSPLLYFLFVNSIWVSYLHK